MSNRLLVTFKVGVPNGRIEQIFEELECKFEHMELLSTYIVTVPGDLSQTKLMNQLGQYPELENCEPERDVGL